jgi:hypothetical protein
MATKSIYQFEGENRSVGGRSEGAIINDRLCIPSLRALFELGADNFRTNTEIGEYLDGVVNFDVNDRVIHDNKVEWEYRMKWALNKLRNGGLIEKDPENYLSWKISEAGIAFLAQNGIQQSTEIEEDQITAIRKAIARLEREAKATKAEQLKASAIRIITTLQEKVRNLEGGEKFNDWSFQEVTQLSFGSPGGSWDAEAFEGYQFKNDTLKKEFILRLVSTDREYIVVESITDRVQIVNYRLDKKEKLVAEDNKTSLIDDGRMTVNYAVKIKKAKKALIEAGFNDKMLITVFEELEGQEEKVVSDILNWASYRLEAKNLIRSQREELPPAVAESDEEEEDEGSNPEANSPNIILYGPPGTGKTYTTIDRSVKIASIERYSPTDHEANKEVFDELVEEGRIVFTTFHQSMGYEDFIEGIKAETDDNGKIKYSVKPGIFRRLVKKAKEAAVIGENFDRTYKKLLEQIKDNGASLILETTEQAKEFTIYENSKGNIKFHANTEKKYEAVIKKEYLKTYLETGECVDWPPYIKGVGKYMIDELGYDKKTKEIKQNFVLIIDEINRGNVSNIFGELITLIEKDKRIDGDNELQITLPYTPNEKFGVPSNLYILGTMNTADRSVEALDTALRRRFVFEEIVPNPLKITDINDDPRTVPLEKEGFINLQDLLAKINKRIEVLIDRDHMIGHSYFMDVEDLNQLKSAFENKIIPLLQEYFYGDYGKIGLVLGRDFVTISAKENDVFAEFKYVGKEELNQPVYKLTDFKQLNFSQAILNLMGIKQEEKIAEA